LELGDNMFDIPAAVEAVSTLADTAIKRIWPDATEIEKAKLEKLTAEMQNEFNLILGQIEINKVEAASSSILVAGWRPYVGWVCGTSLAYVAILEPVLRFISSVIFGYMGTFPTIDTNLTMQILMGMLGFGAFRSFDKKNGLTK
jgi:hypothetical protein